MKKFIFLTVFSVFLSVTYLPAYAMDGGEIVEKANDAVYYQGNDGKSRINMVITDSQGRERNRDMVVLRKNSGGSDQKYYVYFKKPEDVEGMSYLVWKHAGSDDDRWLYLPALDLVRRVASSDKRSSFVGSHFAYEDISGRSTDEDTHTLMGEEDGRYVIKSVPKDPSSVEFTYFKSWIDKDSFIPYRAEYYDRSGKLYKTIEALEVEDVQGFPTITKMKASDFNSGGNTVSEMSDIKYDTGIEDNIFAERFLRRPPRKYMR